MELTKEQKMKERIIMEAWNNPSFKSRLISSPIEAIKELTGVEVTLPEGVNRIEVVDQTDATCSYFNIHAQPNLDNVELTDDQLEAVAGGSGLIYVEPPSIFGM